MINVEHKHNKIRLTLFISQGGAAWFKQQQDMDEVGFKWKIPTQVYLVGLEVIL